MAPSTGWKARLANTIARRFGLQVARRGAAWTLIEPEQLERFLSHFRVDCVFDVGANVGGYGQHLRDIGYRGPIISFEPNPEIAPLLRARAAGDRSWIVKEFALGEEPGTATLNVMREPEFSSLLAPDHSRTRRFIDHNVVVRQVTIEVALIQDLFPVLQRELGFARPFLKMDTQGHDLAVARGCGQCLRAFVGLQSELSVTPLYSGAPSLEEALAYYRSQGFRLTTFVPNNAGHFPQLNEIDCIMYNADLESEAGDDPLRADSDRAPR